MWLPASYCFCSDSTKVSCSLLAAAISWRLAPTHTLNARRLHQSSSSSSSSRSSSFGLSSSSRSRSRRRGMSRISSSSSSSSSRRRRRRRSSRTGGAAGEVERRRGVVGGGCVHIGVPSRIFDTPLHHVASGMARKLPLLRPVQIIKLPARTAWLIY